MKRLAAAIIACAPFAARAEVMDKEPSLAFLLLAALSACAIAYSAARRLQGKLALLGLLPVLFFFPVLLEQLDPVMRQALLTEGGPQYLFSVWLGPASTLLAFATGIHRRRAPAHLKLPYVVFFAAASVLGGLALSSLSGISSLIACLVVAAALLVNGVIATIEDRHA